MTFKPLSLPVTMQAAFVLGLAGYAAYRFRCALELNA
jgi:hypothetical protein